MHLVALSVVCSIVVSVLLKLARRFDVDVRQAIAVNYLVAALLAWTFLPTAPRALFTDHAALAKAWPVYLALAVLLPSIFVVMAVSIRKVGVARTDAAQRLSLLLPLLAAFTVFGEAWSWTKGAGIAVGLAAIGLLLSRPRESVAEATTGPAGGAWRWLLAVFVGLGAIDILFKLLAQLGGARGGNALLAVFSLAFVVSVGGLGLLWWRGALKPGLRHLAGGLVLGLFNFANILFYIRAHGALPRDPALVFSAMNIGVIALGALVGMWLFRERLGGRNKLGLVLAGAAVLIIASV